MNYDPRSHPLYSVWKTICERCYNTGHPRYKEFGGRGIHVCPDWRSDIDLMEKDMGVPNEEEGLDYVFEIIDPTKDIDKTNCRWTLRPQCMAPRPRLKKLRRKKPCAKAHYHAKPASRKPWEPE